MKALIAIAVLFAASQVPAHGALNAYLKLTGQKQGQLKGERSDGTFSVTHFSSAAITSVEMKSGKLNSGHRAWKPLVLYVQPGTNSAMLQKALDTHESLSWELVATQTTKDAAHPNGVINHFDVKLTNAILTSMTLIKTKSGKSMEELQFTFLKITWTWTNGGVTAQDDWSSQTF